MLEGLRVVDLSGGMAGPLTTMLLSDHGADVVKVEPPGGDRFRSNPGYLVWNRGKRSVVVDLGSDDGRDSLRRLLRTADVLVETFTPGTLEALGLGWDELHGDNPRLIRCSITGYGRHSVSSQRPAYDGLVQARTGIQDEQHGSRPGPVHLYVKLPSYGATLHATVALHAALHAREVTGEGQWVETSLAQGAFAWTTMLWFRAEHLAPDVFAGGHGRFDFKDLPATPSFECADGLWIKAMDHRFTVDLAGEDQEKYRPDRAVRSHEERAAYYADLRELYARHPRDFWLKPIQENRLTGFKTQSVDLAFEDPQILHNRAAVDVDLPGIGTVRQFGFGWHLAANEARIQGPPPAVGEHTQEVLASLPAAAAPPVPASPATGRALRHPLEGIRVLDVGFPFAGPWGTMLLGDLGAEVIILEPYAKDAPASRGLDNVWLGCHRGKRCISLDMTTPEGRAVAHELVASADVVHSNRGRGALRAFGLDYETVKAIKADIVYCHTTAYGETGPQAGWPGSDQLAEGVCGLEWEQGAMPAGGDSPKWYRFGQCDHGNGYLSAIAVLQALYHRDRTGEGQAVDTCILNSGMFFSSDAVVAPEGVPTRPHANRDESGLGPLYRMYDTQAGWLFVVASDDAEWQALCRGLGRPDLAGDPRFATAGDREANADALTDLLQSQFRQRTAAAWFEALDAASAPCEVVKEGKGQGDAFFDDPDVVANGWSARYPHAVMGTIEQPGSFFSLSATPSTVQGAPPIRGQHTVEILHELGYDDARVAALLEGHAAFAG